MYISGKLGELFKQQGFSAWPVDFFRIFGREAKRLSNTTCALFWERHSELREQIEKDAVQEIFDMLTRVAPLCGYGTGKKQPGYTAKWPQYSNGKIIDLAFFSQKAGFKVWFHMENLKDKEGKPTQNMINLRDELIELFPQLKKKLDKKGKLILNPSLRPIECVEQIEGLERLLRRF
jgi:hypothetical protein